MNSKPILFSGPMVRAILEDRKRMTRRIMKPQPPEDSNLKVGWYHPTKVDGTGEEYAGEEIFGAWSEEASWRCPYGGPGSKLWVRETWGTGTPCNCGVCLDPERTKVAYRATWNGKGHVDKWRPSIHMPRWASRITLEVTAVRVERLQDISEEDAKAEGVYEWGHESARNTLDWCRWTKRINPMAGVASHRGCFAARWTSINGLDSWAANPWVWVIEFRKIKPE